MRLLSEHCGIVEAPSSRVRELLLRVPTGRMLGRAAPLVVAAQENSPVVISGGPAVFEATVSGVALTIEVDRDAGWVQTRGQWWRCLHYQLQQHPDGTLVIQRTYSTATGRDGEFIAATFGAWQHSIGARTLTHLLDGLASQLACRARILPA
jgi:hypothetical protein